jgi:desulfoferrodoxin (superoxide reductase-like protein)
MRDLSLRLSPGGSRALVPVDPGTPLLLCRNDYHYYGPFLAAHGEEVIPDYKQTMEVTGMKKSIMILACLMGISFLHPATACANKSAVSIEAPAGAEKGADVIVRVTVTHKGNSLFHHTEWLKVDVDGKTVGRWDYSGTNRPEDATFTKEVKVKAGKTLEIVAEANCNVHGSAGQVKATIAVKD